ncbi:MAG: glycerophosphodiester phosphodiesterase [Myxococcales bacterium]|nr:glycerophosphodiester phosphodiesterase [Myxococcales bacterium]MDH3485624.1 glycerophosphodiester phosphodiesterase [Myxococcales bacterium]
MPHPYFGPTTPFPFAHRGGAKRWPENTLLAFRSSADLGIRHIETDLRETADGHFVCFHDDTVERITNGRGFVRDYTLAELQKLDAAHHFERGGQYPYRKEGVRIPTLEEALSLDAGLHYNLDLKAKDPTGALRLWEFISHHRIHDRVLVASEHDEVGDAFRKVSKGLVATSAGFRGAMGFWMRVLSRTARWGSFAFDALQIPPTYRNLRLTTARFVEAAHHHGIQVHVWTIDDPAQMRELLDAGVDAIITDLPDVLLEVLAKR